MLRVDRGDEVWLVTQPDHAAVAGYLAAHWGHGEFARPGGFAPVSDPERLRAESVLAVAQHDNGWWETEASPVLSARGDGLPAGLEEHQRDQEAGFEHWRRGAARFRDTHPYAALLISLHGTWLQRPRVEPAAVEPAMLHPLFWRGLPPPLAGEPLKRAKVFLAEMERMEEDAAERLRSAEGGAAWLAPGHLLSHIRLLQLLDGLSLSLCAAVIPARDREPRGLGEDAFDLLEVPRARWDDRVTVRVTPQGGRRLICEPYPFALDPLPVPVPVRIVDKQPERPPQLATWWYGTAPRQVVFTYASR
jgi:hypothetical protein